MPQCHGGVIVGQSVSMIEKKAFGAFKQVCIVIIKIAQQNVKGNLNIILKILGKTSSYEFCCVSIACIRI